MRRISARGTAAMQAAAEAGRAGSSTAGRWLRGQWLRGARAAGCTPSVQDPRSAWEGLRAAPRIASAPEQLPRSDSGARPSLLGQCRRGEGL